MNNFKCENCDTEYGAGCTVETTTDVDKWKCNVCDNWNTVFPPFDKDDTASPIHPLINPTSVHYQMVDGVEAIIRMEQMYSREDRMAWAKITAMKYRLRIGNKGKVEDDAIKIAGYEAYYKYLDEQSIAR